MPTYRYFTADLRTNAVLEELPLHSVTFSDDLGEPGEFSASLDMFDIGDAATVRRIKEATQPARTAIYVDLDGALQWGGILWKRKKTSDGVCELVGAGFLSFFARQRIAATAQFLGVDQFSMVRQLLAYVQSKPGGNIGVDLGTGLSGVIRDRTYPGIDRKQVLEAVQQLSQVIDGFDLAILAQYDSNGLPGKRLALGYPRLGRAGTTELTLDYPGNVESYSWPEEGDRLLTTVYMRGEGEGEATPTATRTNTALITGGYPSLEDEFTASGVTVQATLDGHAEAYLAAYGAPVVLPEFTLGAGTENPPLSAYGPGDDFLVELTDPQWFPEDEDDGTPGFRGTMRLVKRQVKPDVNAAGQVVTLTMSPFLGAV